MDATGAASEFASASDSFTGVTAALGSPGIAGFIATIPWAGQQFATTRELAGIGSDVAAAGTDLTKVLRDAASSGDASGTPHGIASLLGPNHERLTGALSSLLSAADRASRIATAGLLPPLARAVDSLQSALGEYAPVLDRARGMLPLLRYVGTERRILVVSQDGAELRPTGGFAGSFGIINVGPSGVSLEAYRDVYALPNPPGVVTPPPGALITKDLEFRDANWWLDFPTSAREMLKLWGAAGQAHFDGIVAIDTVMMEDLLETTGPVRVQKFHQTFTAANLLDRLLYLVEIKHVGKGVIEALAQQLEQRVLDSDPSEMAKSADALKAAADSKHLQVYLTDAAAQAGVETLGWSGRVAMAKGGTDLLAVCNAMNRAGKANAGMHKSAAYNVALRADRSADTTLTLRFAATAPFPLALPGVFRDWLRVYRAPGTAFTASPSGAALATATEFGLPAEVRTFTLLRGQSRALTLLARVPGAIAAEPNGTALRYRLRVVRQADLEEIPTTITVSAPAGWKVASASARFTGPGTPQPVTVDGGRVSLSVGLWGDLELDVRLIQP